MEKQQGQRNDILPVVLYDWDQGTAIAGTQVCLVKFRYHLAGDIIVTMNVQDLPFECSETQRGELVPPMPAAEMKDIEMRDAGTGRSVHPIVPEPVIDVGKVECFAIKRYESFSFTGQVADCLIECSLFLSNITEQVLVNIQGSIFYHPDTEENDWPGEQAHGLDIKKNIILRVVQTRCSQHQWVRFCMSFTNEFHDITRIPVTHTVNDRVHIRSVLRMLCEIMQGLVTPGPESFFRCPAYPPDESQITENRVPVVIEIECRGVKGVWPHEREAGTAVIGELFSGENLFKRPVMVTGDQMIELLPRMIILR